MLVMAGLIIIAGCGESGLPEPFSEITEIEQPTDFDARYPFLHVSGDSVLVSWQSRVEDDQTRLYLAGINDTQWSEPELVTEGSEWFVNWADFPVIGTSRSGDVMMSFMTSSGPGTFEYDLNFITRSGGAWNEAFVPHEDGTLTEHGFASMQPYGDDQLLTVWLDGRQMADSDDDEASDEPHDSHGNGDMMLMHGIVDPSDGIVSKGSLDHRVCECCPTASASTDDASIFFYRDRSDDETRNIAFVTYRYDQQEWSSPKPLNEDGWQVQGCPVNGPAADSYDNTVGAAWYTAPDDQPYVKVAFSEDHGESFSEPIVIHEENTLGRVDLKMIDSQTAIVSWIDQVEGQTQLMTRLVDSGGAMGPAQAVKVDNYLADRAAGFPRMTRLNDAIYLGWTRPGEPNQIELIRGELALD